MTGELHLKSLAASYGQFLSVFRGITDTMIWKICMTGQGPAAGFIGVDEIRMLLEKIFTLI